MSTAEAANSWTGQAWSCTMRLVVRDAWVLADATQDLQTLLDQVEAAASRFRPDSALSVANARAGRPTPIPRLLVEMLDAALDAARSTDGAVDPSLGRALEAIGYDRDIARLVGSDSTPTTTVVVPPSAWQSIRLQRDFGLLTVPVGSALDLGATAKAWTADRAARTIAARYRTGVLVELGGDLAVAGAESDGWCIRVAERAGAAGQLITVRWGGVATSTTTIRRWHRGGRAMHHVIDPATGLPVDGPWRTATVAAGSAYAANVASTAALVLGDRAVDWLTDRSFAARLVGRDGAITTTPGWPSDGANTGANTAADRLLTTGATP